MGINYNSTREQYSSDNQPTQQPSGDLSGRLQEIQRKRGSFLQTVIRRSPEVQRALAVERPITGIGWWPLPPERTAPSDALPA
jgi:hypothetical protein